MIETHLIYPKEIMVWVIYYKTEVFSGDEVFKLDSDKLADSMQEWLDGFVKKNF